MTPDLAPYAAAWFGSVLRPGYFGAASDIHLAVEGLAPDLVYRAERRLEEITSFPFDLVELEEAMPELHAPIIARKPHGHNAALFPEERPLSSTVSPSPSPKARDLPADKGR